jgi:N utilization substance protein A
MTTGRKLIIPKSGTDTSDHFRKGDSIRAVVIKVEMRNKHTVIILSVLLLFFLRGSSNLRFPKFSTASYHQEIVRVPGERLR